MTLKVATLLWTALLCLAPAAFSATNDLSTALQKGLFEEEANHDLNAAIQAYQSVAAQFDKDRKLAATAIFRLGECYRKQGNTNQANAQYERVLREFADQTPLVTLSRTYLAASGQGQTGSAAAPAPATSVEAEEVRRIQAMIQNSPDLINAGDDRGRTSLHEAAEKGQIVVAQFLLANGAAVNAKDIGRWTPLHLAARSGHKAMVELLLSHQAEVQAANSTGATPVHLAAQKGFQSVLEVLLAHQASVNARTADGETPLHFAAANGHLQIATLLLSCRADVNARATGAKKEGWTPLHEAALAGRKDIVSLLLQHQADPNVRTESDSGGTAGYTPLLLAAARNNPEIVELLLDAKADPNVSVADHRTPMLIVANSTFSTADRKRMLLALLKHGADPNVKSSNGNSPLALASVENNLELMELLLAYKADVNTQASEGVTP
ncbi:MAG TPA: ankyrin repeat domain-containing protein, partial [Candidatus Sulfotelmatobacter sp.]|nr:ankyrin repeat domain-containing protein [Candidatus Sulfotelmatobacter sp.]